MKRRARRVEAAPAAAGFQEPAATPVRVGYWSTDRIRIAEQMAGQGSIAEAADLVDYLLGDEAIRTVLGTRLDALHGIPVSFEVGRGKKRVALAQDDPIVNALVDDGDWAAMAPKAALKRLQTWAIMLGVGFAQVVQESDPDGRIRTRIDPWHARWFRYDQTQRTWKVRVQDTAIGTQEIPVTFGDGQWVMLALEGGSRPQLDGVWRGLARWRLLKDLAVMDWGGASGAAGSPIVVGTSGLPQAAAGGAATLRTDRMALSKDISALARMGAIALPPGFDIKIVESTADHAAGFDLQVKTSDRAVNIALTGSDMLSAEVGTYGKAQVLDGVRLQLVQGDEESLSACLSEQMLAHYTELNFGRDAGVLPHWDTTPEADLKALGEALTAVGTGVQSLTGLSRRVDVDALLDQFGVPLKAVEPEAPPVAPEGEERAVVARARKPPIAGQVHADAVADAALKPATEAMKARIKKLTDAIGKAVDYDGVRAAVLDHYAASDPSDLADIVERAMVLAHLGGRLAITEENEDAA